MGTTMRHMGICVRGVLRWNKSKLNKLFTDDNGRNLSADEAIDYLPEKLSKGWEYIPMGKCDNFDKKSGCKGHPVRKGKR